MTKEQQFKQEDRQLSKAMDREAENKAKYIELSEFKNKADVYYQQLTKASKQKGLGSHEHIYFTYGIEWAFNHLPQSEVNKNDLILNLQLQNSILKNAIKDFWDAGFNYCSSKQDRTIELFGVNSQPDFNTFYDTYFIDTDLSKPDTDLHPIFKNITDSIFPIEKTDL